MTNEQKFEIALFYFKKHGSLVNYGRVFNDTGQLKKNVTLHDIEECIKTDPYIGAGTGCPCDTCIHCQNGFCSLYSKNKSCENYNKWHFQYVYWSNVMKREKM